mmetsp:Transcript_766/g.1124  ORF Transcript_766/g.1124 Transcript_766/m.1124 type:complete len:187 (+) Transcript_766:66-626(+)
MNVDVVEPWWVSTLSTRTRNHNRVSQHAKNSFVRYFLKRNRTRGNILILKDSFNHIYNDPDLFCPSPCLPGWFIEILRAGRPLKGEIVEGHCHAVHGIVSYECDGCAICWEEFGPGRELTLLPCGHVWHSNCLEKWIKCHTTCPGCRQDLNVMARQMQLEGGAHPCSMTLQRTRHRIQNMRMLNCR